MLRWYAIGLIVQFTFQSKCGSFFSEPYSTEVTYLSVLNFLPRSCFFKSRGYIKIVDSKSFCKAISLHLFLELFKSVQMIFLFKKIFDCGLLLNSGIFFSEKIFIEISFVFFLRKLYYATAEYQSELDLIKAT